MENIIQNCTSYLTGIGFVEATKDGLIRYERKGKTLGILPYGDYLYFHEGVQSSQSITQMHDQDRAQVNAEFRVPKALRLSVPNIVSIFFLEESPSSQMIELVHSANRNMVGGEVHAIVVVDLPNQQVHLPSNKRYVMNFKGIDIANPLADRADPTNRANGILQKMFAAAFAS